MSSVEDRVVAMKFDNNAFERAAAVTLSTLQKLKTALQFTGSLTGLNNLGAAAKKADMSPVSAGADQAGSRLSAMGVIGVTALATIANKAVDTGLQLTKSLTVGQIGDGFNDYNAKLTSVQTVVNATGRSLEDVGGFFNQLDTYADKTVFKLSDMTSALSKFTNAGVDLETAIPAIQGIGNMTAFAGQGAESASIAYYNLAQSLAGGFMTRSDFKSLELANVATKTFKEEMINAAVAAGELKRNGDGTFTILTNGADKTMKANELFIDGLQEGWASTAALIPTLSKFADAETELGKKAWGAAQDVKSIPMMMDTLKAAVGTSWTDTFEIIFGDLEESKELFTGLTNTIGGFLGKIADHRNEILRTWDDMGGRTMLITGLKLAFDDLFKILKPIGEAFRDVFPAMTGERLFELTKSFARVFALFEASEGTLENIRRTFAGVFAVVHIGIAIVKGFFGVIGQLLGAMFNLEGGSGGLLSLTASLGDFLVSVDNALTKGGGLAAVFETIGNVLSVPIKLIGALSNAIADLFGHIDGDAVQNGFTNMFDGLSEAIGQADFSGAGVLIGGALAGGIFIAIKKFLKNIEDIFQLGGDIINSITEPFKALTGVLSAMQAQLKAKALMNIAIAVGVLAGGMFLLSRIDGKDMAKSMAAMAVGFGQLVGVMILMMKFSNKWSFITMPAMAGAMILIASAMVILAAAMKIFATMSWEEMVKGLVGVGGGLIAVGKAMEFIDTKGLLRKAAALTVIGVALNLLAVALKIFATMSWQEMGKGFAVMAGGLAALGIALEFVDTKRIIRKAAGLAILGVALNGIALALKLFGSMSWTDIAQGLVALGGSIAILAIGLNAMGPGAIVGAAALMLAAAALAVLAPVLVVLGSLSWSTIGKGLAVLVGGMVAIGLAGLIMTPVVPTLAALAGVAALLGVAMLAAGGGMLMFGQAVAILTGVSSKELANFKAVLDTMATAIPDILKNIGIGLVEFAGVIATNGKAWTEALVTILISLLDAVITVTPKLGETLRTMIHEGLRVIRSVFPDVVDTAFDLLFNFLDEVRRNTYRIVSVAIKIVQEFMRAIGDQAGPLADSAAKMIIKFVNGVARAIDNNAADMRAAGQNLARAIIDGMTGGLASGLGRVRDKAREVAKGALDAAKNFLGINSPSKEFAEVGKWSVLGMARGLVQNAPTAAKAAVSIAQSAVTMVRNKMAELSGMDSTIRPVVAPVLDLSDYRRNASTLQSAFTNPQLSADISTQNASTISNLDEARLAAQTSATSVVTKEVKLEQNNYSPKALDPIEIYRNTKSLLALEKEAS